MEQRQKDIDRICISPKNPYEGTKRLSRKLKFFNILEYIWNSERFTLYHTYTIPDDVSYTNIFQIWNRERFTL